MSDSGILEQVFKIQPCSEKNATHFLIGSGTKLRYLISLDGGGKRLSGNISAYSKKMEFLLKGIAVLPAGAFKLAGLGYFAEAALHPAVEAVRQKTDTASWNAIIGTCDEKQKIVLQCFQKHGPAVYMKIGNAATEAEMRTEIEFLQSAPAFRSFSIPRFVSARLRNDTCPFNIQITEEFTGTRVQPVLTEEIAAIYRELSGFKKVTDGAELELSHGDFAPWNLKATDSGYIVFDWEHCGYRMKGFDLMHFAYMVQVLLYGKSGTEAWNAALAEVRKFQPEFEGNRDRFLHTLSELRHLDI